MCFQTTTSLWIIFFEVMVLTLRRTISNIFIPLSICLPTNVGHQWPGQPGEDSKVHVAKNICENTFFHQLLFRNSNKFNFQQWRTISNNNAIPELEQSSSAIVEFNVLAVSIMSIDNFQILTIYFRTRIMI